MSQMSRVVENQAVLREMQTFYSTHFPMEVRFYLSHWIEEQQWDQIDETSSQYLPVANSLLQNMLTLLQSKVTELNSPDHFVTRIQLEQSIQKLQKVNSLDVIRAIKSCLAQEKMLIEQTELMELQQQELNSPTAIGPELNETSDRIQAVLLNLFQKTKETETISKDMHLKQEQFIISFSEGQQINSQLQELEKMAPSEKKTNKVNELRTEKNKVAQDQNRLANELLNLRIAIGYKYRDTIKGLDELQKQILEDELISWKRRQQLSGNGLVTNNSSLEALQHWCEELADLVWQNRQQIKKVSDLQKQLPIQFPDGETNQLEMLDARVTGLLTTLVTSTFIVEQQPPQVLKKGGRFGAVVRLLVGEKLNLHTNPPRVVASIINASQAKQLLCNEDRDKIQNSGDILNNSGNMEYNATSRQLSLSLRNMTLKKIKRNGKKGSEAVTEEKFCIMFQADFRMGGGEVVFDVWTLSLPVVVTVHGTQECNASATILWDNAFSESGRLPFIVPDQVEWHQLADQLNMKFRSSTGKGLSETNQAYIASKLFGDKDPSKCYVTWAQFNKDTLPEKQFTFWEWFYAIEKLTREHLKDLWVADTIIGFLSKDQARNWLSTKQPGTFLLRFSDSKSGISIAWLEDNKVRHLAPSNAKDLVIRGLADRIKDSEELTTLYPDKDKKSVFSKYYTDTTDKPCVNVDGYVEPEIKSAIPKLSTSPLVEDTLSMPYTPDSFISSPGSVLQPLSVQSDVSREEVLPVNPIMDGIADMDISSVMDYMPDDIQGVGIGEEEVDLNQVFALGLYSGDPNMWQNNVNAGFN